MTTWTLNGRTWGYRQSDVPGSPYYLMGSQVFKVWHLLMWDIAATAVTIATSATGASTAKTSAEAARDAAADSATAAGNAKTGAEGARDAAQGHATAASTARNGAETARDTAQGYAVDAETAKTGADAARDTAQGHAAAAGTARNGAETARDAAQGFATAAGTAKSGADTAKSGAETARDLAAGSAATAVTAQGQVASDRAATQTALASAQTLVGTAGTGTATGLAYAQAVKSLLTAADVSAVWIYDTRADSDGGAWAARPSGSWYWEALGTATRGATRRFPAVAIIVARAASITIYDAHDLDATASALPRMWMVFSLAAGGWAAANVLAEAPTGLFAAQGRLWVSSSGGTYGLLEIDFANDRAMRRTATAGNGGRYRGTLAARNGGQGYAQDLTAAQTLVATSCSAVHARALPGAPLDTAGLTIPTVVVATPAGLSVIHHWGTVYDITRAAGHARAHLTSTAMVVAQQLDSNPVEFGPLPYADAANTSWRRKVFAPSTVPALPSAPNAVRALAVAGSDAIAMGATMSGLSLLLLDASNADASMTAQIGIDRNTGWMVGDCRGAWLCDTVTGAITGSGELVANGGFAGGTTTNWTPSNANLSVVASTPDYAMRVTATVDGQFPQARQSVTTVPGQTYLLCYDLVAGATTSGVLVGTSAGIADLGVVVATVGTRAWYQYTAPATTTHLSTQHGTPLAGQTADYDNISQRLALPDRGIKARGMMVVGTLTRTATACGIAALSGFSTTAYLYQPYFPDHDYNGALFVAAWIMPDTTSGTSRTIVSRGGGTWTGARWRLIVGSGNTLYAELSDGTNTVTVSGVTAVNDNRWHHACLVMSGGTVQLWLDGVRDASASTGALGDMTNTAASLTIGLLSAGSGFFAGSLAMVRVGAGVPGPAQIRRMYQDERALIIAGQAATLGGTTNNVTAVAANEAAGTWLIGTGDGVSVLSGLSRVQYLDGASGGVAIADDAITALSGSGPHLLIGTAANAGLISDGVIARDRLAPAGPPRAALSQDRQVMEARGVTTDATPTDLAPRLYVGEREAVTLDVTVQARTYGATSTQGGTYRRLARYIRDGGGNVTLSGTVQTIGADQETTAGMDVALQIDTAAQTVTPRVTGVAGTRIVWTARITVTRISEDLTYAVQ